MLAIVSIVVLVKTRRNTRRLDETRAETERLRNRSVAMELQLINIRAELDLRPEKIGYKVREAEGEKVPFVAVLGAREVEDKKVALRGRGRKDLGAMSVKDLIKLIKEQVEKKKQ